MGARSLILALLLGACQGPRPTVRDVRVAAGPLPGRVRVTAVVANQSRGEGQIDVRIQLRDRKSGKVVEESRDLDLRGKERVELAADVEAPAGDWEARVEAEYPPR